MFANNNISFFIALRLLRPTQSLSRSIGLIISLTGVVIGVVSLVITLSTMNGFERDVRNQVLGMSGHINLIFGKQGSQNWKEKLNEILTGAEVLAFSPYLRSGAMISSGEVVISVLVEGVVPDTEESATDITNYVDLSSSLASDELIPTAVIGEKLAKKLNVSKEQVITLITPRWDLKGRFSGPEHQLIKVTGIFKTGMAQYDHKLLITSLSTAQNLFRVGDLITGVKVRLDDPAVAAEKTIRMNASLPDNIHAIDWSHYNQNFFLALKSQKKLMFIILLMVIAIAASSAAINMLILVKRNSASIALLKTLGAAKTVIVKIFLIQGFMIGISGCAIGIPLGVLLVSKAQALVAFIEQLTGFSLINPEVYLIDHLPYLIKATDLSLIGLSTICITVFAAVFPAYKAGAVNFFEKTEY
jgi:lipoprotein-releasing system permease protein